MTNRKFNVVPTKATIVPADLVVLIDSEDGMKLKQASSTSFVGPTGSTGPAGADGVVQTLVAGTNISIDDTDPANPIVSLSLGADDNFVTDAEKTVLGNTSGTNSGDNATNTQYSGLATSKQDTLVSGTNIKTINGTTILGSGDLEISAGSGGYAANVYLTTLTSAVVGSYKQTSYTPEVAETLVSGTANNNTVLVDSYIFDLPLGITSIPSGTWEFHPTCYVNSATNDTRLIFETYSRTVGGTETLLFTTTSAELNNTTRSTFTIQNTQPAFTVNATDYIVMKVYVSTTSVTNKTLTYVVGDGQATHLITPIQLRHSQLRARDEADSHPIGAITGLTTALSGKVSTTGAETIAGNKTFSDSVVLSQQLQRTASGVLYLNASNATGEIRLRVNGGDRLSIASDGTVTILGNIELGNASDCTLSRSAAGKLAVEGVNIGTEGILQNSKSVAYTTVLADAGKHIYHPSADTTARTWTIDSNANVAYPIGTAITFVNDISAGVITIAITSDTLLFTNGTTGSRTLAANSIATALKITSTKWLISGSSGLT